jgi:O-succinylbenzoate synthase
MKITEVNVRSYELPLASPMQLAGQTLTARRGLIVSLTDSDGTTAHGEAAPLPGFHDESFDDALEQLQNIKADLVDMSVDGGFFELAIDLSQLLPLLYPSVRMAIETALFNLGLKRNPMSLGTTTQRLPVNALLISDSPDCVEKLIADGFTSIKIKVGAKSVANEIDRLTKIIESVDERATIRLDANRAWNLDQAVEFVTRIGPDRIEYIEEPTKTSTDHKALYDRTGVGIALDETIVLEGVKSYPYFDHISALVLKPSLLGGFSLTALLMDLAKRNNTTPVISSCFESGLGISSLALFAASMNLTNTPVGLDTLKYFQHDLLARPLEIEQGAIKLSQAFGCIDALNEKLLKEPYA